MRKVGSKAEGGTTTETQSYSFAATGLPVGTHQFRLKQVDLDGGSTLTDPVTVDIQMQEALKLRAPAPNPASGTATLSFAVKEQAETTLRLYNTLGQQVATVYEGTPQAGEEQRAQVDVSSLSSGTYFLRLSTDGQTRTRRLTVVRRSATASVDPTGAPLRIVVVRPTPAGHSRGGTVLPPSIRTPENRKSTESLNEMP